MRARIPIALVAVTLLMVGGWRVQTVLAQAAPGVRKIDPKVVDPQAAIKAAAAAFKQARAIENFTPAKTAWGDPDVSGYYLVATYTPLQRPERLKDKPFFTEDEAIAELARVIGQDAEVDPRNVHYDWKEYGMDGWQSPIRPSLRTSLIVDPPDGRIPPLSPEGQKRRAERAAAARARAPEVSVRTLASTYTRCITGNAAGGPLVRGGNPDPANTTGRSCSRGDMRRSSRNPVPTCGSSPWMDVRCRRRTFARGLAFRAVIGKATRLLSRRRTSTTRRRRRISRVRPRT